MTDEGIRGEPLDSVEALAGMQSAAALVRAFYDALIGEGYSDAEALKLTTAYVHGLAGGKLS